MAAVGKEEERVLPLVSFNHKSHACYDFEYTQSFYKRVLGFQSTPRPDISVRGAWVVHNKAGCQVHFLDHPPPLRPKDDLTLTQDHTCFTVGDLQQSAARLRLHGVEFRWHQCTSGEAHVSFKDPDYNLVVLVQDDGDNNNPHPPPDDPTMTATGAPPPVEITSMKYQALATRRIDKSLAFFSNVLGFKQELPTERCGCVESVWLGNERVGFQYRLIPVSPSQSVVKDPEIEPADDHLAFYIKDIDATRTMLQRMNIAYKSSCLPSASVSQIFFHDPDDNMVEMCTCEDAVEQFQPCPEYKLRCQQIQQRTRRRLTGGNLQELLAGPSRSPPPSPPNGLRSLTPPPWAVSAAPSAQGVLSM